MQDSHPFVHLTLFFPQVLVHLHAHGDRVVHVCDDRFETIKTRATLSEKLTEVGLGDVVMPHHGRFHTTYSGVRLAHHADQFREFSGGILSVDFGVEKSGNDLRGKFSQGKTPPSEPFSLLLREG